MNDVTLNIKVAELDGWEHVRYGYWIKNSIIACCRFMLCDDYDCVDRATPSLPRYIYDLNLMHEVEKVFVKHDGCVWGDDWELYCQNLEKVCFMSESTNCLCRATAKQRAEAFIITMEFLKNDNKKSDLIATDCGVKECN
jgi:hypothetical protein